MKTDPHTAEKNSSAVERLERELQRTERHARFRRTLLSTLFSLVIVAAVAVLASTLLLPAMQIYGTSMSPTLQAGDVVVSVRTGSAAQGELVAFYYGNKVLVKRCIGRAGDVIDIDASGSVSVNGTPLDEPYLTEKALGACDIDLPYQVPDGRFFVIGDQRATSIDSRNSLVGCIAPEQMVGRIAFRIWPLDRFGPIQ